MVDTKAFRSLSYGLYIVTAQSESGRAGCVVNTFQQVTSTPPQVSVAINKENRTTDVLFEAGMFEVSVLAESAPMELIGRFGFHSSADTDKYTDTVMAEDGHGVSFVAEHAVAHFCVKVKATLGLGTHMYVMGEVVESEVLAPEPPMTYAYYHVVKGGKTPPKASSFEAPEAHGEAPASKGGEEPAADQGEGAAASGESAAASGAPKAWRCTICGHIEYGYPNGLPEDFKCPICGMGREFFEPVEA